MKKTALLLASAALAVLLVSGVTLTVGIEHARAAFPGPNGRIAFVEERDAQAADDLKLVRPDGSGLVTLVSSPHLSSPAFSPNGTRVAYTRGVGRAAEIFLINISNRSVRQLTNNAVSDSDPTWSPDGARVAFVRTHDDGFDVESDILVSRVDGTGTPVNVTNTPLDPDEFMPAWSPNGEEIAFSADSAIFVLNLATGQRRNLSVDGVERDNRFPNWSPDGTRIVFDSLAFVGRPDCGRSSSIITMNASDGSDRRVLTRGCTDVSTVDGVVVSSPAYSPDGRQIAYARNRSDLANDLRPHRRELMRMNATTGANKRPIYNVPSPRFFPFARAPDWGVKVQR